MKHAHASIAYTNIGTLERYKEYGDQEYQVETMFGFDPHDPCDRKHVHAVLDEYLDYMERVLDGKAPNGNTANGFRVFHFVDE